MMTIINKLKILSYSLYRWGTWNSERWPQLLQRNKWWKWDWEKGCVSSRSPCSCHHCIVVLLWGFAVPFYGSLQHLHALRGISITPKVRSVPLSPFQLPSLLFSVLHSSPLWDLAPTPIWATLPPSSWLPAKSSDSCSPRTQVLTSNFEAARNNTEVLTHRLPSLRHSFLIYEIEVRLSPPKVEWNNRCKMLSTGLVFWGLPAALSFSRLCLAKIRPPSLHSNEGASLRFVHSLDAMPCQVQGLPLKRSQFPQSPSYLPRGQGSTFPAGGLAEDPAHLFLLPHLRTVLFNRIFWSDRIVLYLHCPKWKPVPTSGHG